MRLTNTGTKKLNLPTIMEHLLTHNYYQDADGDNCKVTVGAKVSTKEAPMEELAALELRIALDTYDADDALLAANELVSEYFERLTKGTAYSTQINIYPQLTTPENRPKDATWLYIEAYVIDAE